MDALHLLQEILPTQNCNGLNHAILTFDGKHYTAVKPQLELYSNEVGLNNVGPTLDIKRYITLDIPSIYSYSSTFITGIRGVNASPEVYISGFSTAENRITLGYTY